MEQRRVIPIKKIAVIVNPASGGSEAPLRALNEALATFESTVQVTQSVEDGARFSREAVSREVDLILVFGGDGTVSQVVDGLGGSAIPLLILRGGTGNLIADELNLPASIPENLALFADGKAWVRPVDLGIVNRKTRFILRCGCGLEVKALQETAYARKADWGKLAYAEGLLKGLSGHASIDFRIWIDESSEPIEESGVSLTVANAGRIGAGTLLISPTVSMSDGLLDDCLIQTASLKTVMEFFLSGLSGDEPDAGSLEAASIIRVQKARRIRVETGRPLEFHVDGEIQGMTPFEIEVCPSAAWVVVAPAPEDEPAA